MPKATALEKAILLPRLKKSLETFTSTVDPFQARKTKKQKKKQQHPATSRALDVHPGNSTYSR